NDRLSDIALGMGATGSNYNFGELRASKLSGYVYVDKNNNGIKEAGEQGIAGVTVTLTGTDDLGSAVHAVQATAGDGSYGFISLRPGTYTVTETQPSGYQDGKDAV